MAYTQDQLTALTEAIALGANTVKYGDKEVTYRSLSDMLRLVDVMKTELGIKQNTKRKYASFSRGFESQNELDSYNERY